MRSKQKDRGKSSSEIALNKKIVAPQKLKILVLAGNDLLNQHLQFLTKCVNLVKVDVSHNHISKLPEKDTMLSLTKLQVVFLHYNKLSSLDGIRPLYSCTNLVHLTYHHNPLEVHIKNEHEIVNSLTNLKLVNNRVVFVQERANWLLHERMAVRADESFLQGWKSTENSQLYYLKVLNLHLNYISFLWAFHNPIVVIQRAWRRILLQSKDDDPLTILPLVKGESSKRTKRKEPATANNDQRNVMRNAFSQWKKWSEGVKSVREAMKKCIANGGKEPDDGKKKDKGYLLLPLQEYKKELRNMKVRQPVLMLLQKIRLKIYQRRMAEKLAANMKLKYVLFASDYSFYSISGIQENGRLYYNRNQQHILDHFLDIIGQHHRAKVTAAVTFKPSRKYNAIRLVDPETYVNRFAAGGFISLNKLIWPSMKVVICSHKKVPSHFKRAIIGTKQLTYITNRDKVLSKGEKKKSMEVYQRLQKFALNEYESSLWEMQCGDEKVMRQFLRLLYYHNSQALKFQVKSRKSQMLALMRNYEQPLMVYVDQVLKRTAAAVLIQKTWRRYVSNKSQPQSIYHKINQNRAALHIQKFYRNYRYFHRQRFNKHLAQLLPHLNTNSIAYPLQLYLNMDLIDKLKSRNKLFKQLRVSRGSEGVGVSEEFFRPIFHKRVRDEYLGGRTIGMQHYENEVGIYNLVHYKVKVGILESQVGPLIQLTYPSPTQTNLAACLIALFTYQPWGSRFLWPFSTANMALTHSIKQLAPFIKLQPNTNTTIPTTLTSRIIQPKGLLICKEEKVVLGSVTLKKCGEITVEFYQKRYHNFPVKHQQTLKYLQFEQTPKVIEKEVQQPVYQQQTTKQFKYLQLIKDDSKQASGLRLGKQRPGVGAIGGQTGMSIRSIENSKVHLFEQVEVGKKSEKEDVGLLSKTVSVMEDKKKQVKKHYQQDELRREAQKELKEATLTGIREKAKQEKLLNSTLRNLKQAERTHQLRNRVQQIKQITQNPLNMTQQQDFVQQNNFVMQQQLRMIMMRTQMKQAEKKREEHSNKKTSVHLRTQHFTPSLHSRHSQLRKAPIEQDERQEEAGQEGSVVNARKRVRKNRAQSIGAYVRDPSFVHGVFPQEYYPIQNRATTFYFPPVL